MSWDQYLEPMKWGDIEIHVESSSDDYSRRIVQYNYPYKDGAELEDLGREPRPSSFRAIFFGNDYLPLLVDFLKEVDKGETRTLQHPLFGQWEARCVRAVVDHEHSRRNSAAVDLEFLEDGVNTEIPDVFSVGTAQEALSEDITGLETANELLTEEISTVPTLITDAEAFIQDVDDQVTDLTARFEKISKAGKEAVAELEAKIDDAVNSDTVRAVRRVVDSASRLKERVERLAPSVAEMEIDNHTPMVAVAMRLYGDPARADDLIRLNKIRDPFLVPPGTRLRVYSE